MKEVAKEQMLTQCAAHAQYVLQLLQLQQQTGFLCDITIQVKDCSFKAHKPLLAACSLYFRFVIKFFWLLKNLIIFYCFCIFAFLVASSFCLFKNAI